MSLLAVFLLFRDRSGRQNVDAIRRVGRAVVSTWLKIAATEWLPHDPPVAAHVAGKPRCLRIEHLRGECLSASRAGSNWKQEKKCVFVYAVPAPSFLTLVPFSDLTEGTEDPSNVVGMEATPDLPPCLRPTLVLAPCVFAVPLCGETAPPARKA